MKTGMKAIAHHNFVIPDRCLAVFIDDTGHEALVPNQPVYGLGGCAALGSDLNRTIHAPWREVRQRISGSADTPLHANEFARNATPEQISIIAEFFQTQPFARLGAIISTNTILADELSSVQIMAKVLQQRIVDIARWTVFDSLVVIFEASERADALIEAAFQDFAVEENGKPIPVECAFMSKDRADPALEVADFVMHAIGRQARQNLKKRGDFLPDFCAVFHTVDRKLASFMEVSSVIRNQPASI